MKALLEKALNIGVKSSYQTWEINLTRRLNLFALLALSNMFVSMLFLFILDIHEFVYECLFAIAVIPFVFLFNKHKNYNWSVIWFYTCNFIFFIPITLKMGVDSYILLFYFPMIIGMMHILGRKETLPTLYFLSGLSVLFVIIVVVGFNYPFFELTMEKEFINRLQIFNILLSFICTITLTLFLVADFIHQEKALKKVLNEKEILLAEVFHRVKNNMNVMTSLLNLKKNTVESEDAKIALEECKNRVYSMALVHQNIFDGNTIEGLNFRQYIENLVAEIAKSFGYKDKVQLFFDTEEVTIDINKAVPCGLILNELITNSFKHAHTDEDNLQIMVKFKKQNERNVLEVQDNGPGITEDELNSTNTLGIELIKSLADQINANYSFENEKGLVFRLTFE